MSSQAEENRRKRMREDPEYLAKRRATINKSQKKRYYADADVKEKMIDRNRETEKSRRERVITFYGGKCAVCGITELRFLTLDHSFNDGAEHRRRLNKSNGSAVYRDIMRRGFPENEGYRVLCWNHNCGGAY